MGLNTGCAVCWPSAERGPRFIVRCSMMEFFGLGNKPRTERCWGARELSAVLKRMSCPNCSQSVLEAAGGSVPGIVGGAREALPGCA